MTIQLTFSPVLADYAARRYPVIRNLEEPGGVVSTTPYRDSVGLATIGAGFLVRANVVEILQTLLGGVRPNDDQIATLTSAVSNATGGHRTFATNADAQTSNRGQTTIIFCYPVVSNTFGTSQNNRGLSPISSANGPSDGDFAVADVLYSILSGFEVKVAA